MRTFLRRLILVLVIAVVATLLWDQKDRIGLLNNNGMRIQGEWYRVEMDFKGEDEYIFDERMISRNGDIVGSYLLRKNTELEVTLDGSITDYVLSFEDDDNMVWLIERNGKRIPAVRWRR